MNLLKGTLWVVSASLGIALSVVSTWSSTGCFQPSIDCRAARGDFAVAFTKVEGDCGDFTVGFVGLQSFYPADGDKQNYDTVLLAMQSEVLGGLLQNSQSFGPEFVDTQHTAYGIGPFTAVEPVDRVCEVPTLTPSEQDIPAIPGEGTGGAGGSGGAGGATGSGGGATGSGGAGGAGGGGEGGAAECEAPEPEPFPGEPHTDIKIEWSNVKLYVTTEAPGTQFVADMKYSEDIDGTTCTATYKLIGIWPPVDCGVYEYDDCGNLLSATPNEDACHLEAATAPPGSVVLNPEFKVKCDPDLLYCVPTQAVKSLQ